MKGIRIRYLGHSSFELKTSKSTRIIIDPYQNSLFKHWFKQKFPKIEADTVIVTHDHFDHNAYRRILGNPKILKKPTTYRGKDYTIKLVGGEHARSREYNFYENNITLIEIEKVRICHWGDNEAKITKSLKNELRNIDVLMLPIDESEHILTLTEVENMIEKIRPKIVIPMHYFNYGLTTRSSSLKSISNWLQKQRYIRKIPLTGITIKLNNLPKKREIWVFARSKYKNK